MDEPSAEQFSLKSVKFRRILGSLLLGFFSNFISLPVILYACHRVIRKERNRIDLCSVAILVKRLRSGQDHRCSQKYFYASELL